MSRIIPTDKPLSEEDRAYLLMRGEDGRVKWFDDVYPSEPEAAPADEDADTEDVEDDEDLEDDEEDDEDAEDEDPAYDEWTIAELKAEIDKRNKKAGPDAQMTVSGTKPDLAARLRENDAANQ